MEPVCASRRQTIREWLRLYAARALAHLSGVWGFPSIRTANWTMSRCLIASTRSSRASVGRPCTGAASAARAEQVQGASDEGLIPIVFPEYKFGRGCGPAIRSMYDAFWHNHCRQEGADRGPRIMQCIKTA